MFKKINLISSIFLGLLIINIGFISILQFNSSKNIENFKGDVSTEFNFMPSVSTIKNNQRLSYLYSVIVALNQYKNDHNHYPITLNNGKGWSIVYAYEYKANWIEGLIPDYLDKLPYNVIEKKNSSEQYIYQSDGANYKLVVYYPPDCDNVGAVISDKMIKNDLNNSCIGYGFWTKESKWNHNPPLPEYIDF